MADTIALNVEAKKLNAPTNKLVSSFVGINELKKQATAKKTTNVTEVLTNKAAQPFTIDDLRKNWRKFAYIAKDRNLDTLYNAMVAGEPTIGDNFLIKYTVSNEVQLGFIKANEAEVLGYLRKELNNWSIQLSLKEESDAGDLKPFTSKEIYDSLVEKNKFLEEMRNLFHLDLD